MSDLIEESIILLNISIEKEKSLLEVINAGIKHEQENIKILEECLEQMHEAFNLIRDCHRIVSLNEYKKILVDVSLTEQGIKSRDAYIYKLKQDKKIKEKEIQSLNKKVTDLENRKKNGKIIQFRK